MDLSTGQHNNPFSLSIEQAEDEIARLAIEQDTLRIEFEKSRNEIARLTIERDHYHAALLELKTQLWQLWSQAAANNGKETILTAVSLSRIASIADNAWRFRQAGCPNCGMPCKLTFALVEVGPNIRSWDCPNCGNVGNVEAANSLKKFADEAIEKHRC